MRMGPLGRALYNSRARAAVQRRWVLPGLSRLGAEISGRVVELGAGGGAGAALLLAAGANEVVALDLDPIMTDAVRGRSPRAIPVIADSARLPLRDSVADVVADVVADLGGIHLADPWQTILSEAHRVLVHRGQLLLEQPVNPFVDRVPALGRLGGFSERQLLDALDATGFRVVATDRLGPFGLDLLVVAVKNDDA